MLTSSPKRELKVMQTKTEYGTMYFAVAIYGNHLFYVDSKFGLNISPGESLASIELAQERLRIFEQKHCSVSFIPYVK